MITPIKALNIWDLMKRENDLLVSDEDIKKIAMNERKQILRFLPMCCQKNDDENLCTLSQDECFECMERTINNLDEYFKEHKQ